MSRRFRSVEATLRALCAYHDHRVYGLDRIPSGPALIAFHHSLATYDSFLLAIPILDQLGRTLRGLADRLIFRTPGLGALFTGAGFVEGTRDATRRMLQQGELIGLAPGGMREALRPSGARYRFDWTDRRGFVRVAMEAGAPIVLAACPRADDLYTVIGNPVTRRAYAAARVPVPVAFGRLGTAIPRPVPLWHLLSEPLVADVPPDRVTDRDVQHHHRRVVARMTTLMAESLALGPAHDRHWSPR
ncbi:MAG: lysophospholipid acyltransferase family protein [Myxococcota bacterium]